MNILILGSGGREHAFAWKLKQSLHCQDLLIAPGNAGTATLGENIDIDPNDFPAIGRIVRTRRVGLVIIGPEEPLARGVRDYFLQFDDLKAIPLVGPDKQGAMLESSKDFAKQFMLEYDIPTASYQTFTLESLEDGLRYLEQQNMPIVLKADGLAAGKGVVICEDLRTAQTTLREMLQEAKFGAASSKVVIEEFLSGIELSVFVLTDGTSYKILPSAKDYKRIGENDTGPNTGGMGAVSPVPFATIDFMHKVEEQIIKPTIGGLKARGIDYRGFLFLGLINVAGNPMVIEYNARMGDPETQVVFPRIVNDMVDLMSACAQGTLQEISMNEDPRTACTVVLVSGGYPGYYEKGHPIEGLEHKSQSIVFHAGTSQSSHQVHTNGGRVLAVTSFGDTLEEAVSGSYDTISHISWPGMNYRQDIGRDLMTTSNNSL